jgi:hypothetical protein
MTKEQALKLPIGTKLLIVKGIHRGPNGSIVEVGKPGFPLYKWSKDVLWLKYPKDSETVWTVNYEDFKFLCNCKKKHKGDCLAKVLYE